MTKIVSNFFKNEVADMLKKEGFSRRGNSLIKESSTLVFEITLEKYRWNTPGSTQFWILLKIYLGKEDAPRFTLTKWLQDYSLVFSKRLGYLWGAEDYKYTYNSFYDLDALKIQIKNDFDKYLFPFLNTVNTQAGLIEYLDSENQKLGYNFFSFTLAIGLARMGQTGQTETAEKYFKESAGDKAFIKKTALTYGIDLK